MSLTVTFFLILFTSIAPTQSSAIGTNIPTALKASIDDTLAASRFMVEEDFQVTKSGVSISAHSEKVLYNSPSNSEDISKTVKLDGHVYGEWIVLAKDVYIFSSLNGTEEFSMQSNKTEASDLTSAIFSPLEMALNATKISGNNGVFNFSKKGLYYGKIVVKHHYVVSALAIYHPIDRGKVLSELITQENYFSKYNNEIKIISPPSKYVVKSVNLGNF